MGDPTKPTAKDKLAETKKRYSKYLQVMKSSKARDVSFAFGTAPDEDGERGFLIVHELKSAAECLSRVKDQAKEWGLKLDASGANLGTLRQDERGVFVFSCERGLRTLKADLKKYLAQAGGGALKFRLQAAGESQSDEGDAHTAAPAERSVPASDSPTASDGEVWTPGKGKMPPNGDIYRKARTAWTTTRAMIVQDLDKFAAAVKSEYAGEPDAGDIEANVRKLVDKIKANIDDGLSKDLERAGDAVAAKDATAWATQRDALVARIDTYRRYRNSEPALKQLDNNPLVSVAVVQKLDRTLDVLATWLA